VLASDAMTTEERAASLGALVQENEKQIAALRSCLRTIGNGIEKLATPLGNSPHSIEIAEQGFRLFHSDRIIVVDPQDIRTKIVDL